MTRIAILETGHPPEHLKDDFDDYPARFRALLGEGVPTTRFDVQSGNLPEDPAAFQGAIVTGSAAGVYDDLPWIPPLIDWLRAARGRTRLVGICFGHQVMAKALGGTVEKFKGGWAAGASKYWREDLGREQTVLAWHQDQVIERPPGAEVVGSNEFCENAVLRYGDWGLSFQPHPEFSKDYYEGLAEVRKYVMPDEQFQRVRRVEVPLSTDSIADEIGAFLAKPRVNG